MSDKKNVKALQHNFVDKHTVPAALLLLIAAEIIAQLCFGMILGGIFAFLFPQGSDMQNIMLSAGVIFGAFFVLALFWRYFYPEYEGSLRGGEHLGIWLLIALTMSCILLIVQILMNTDSKLAVPSAVNLTAALMAGISEEVIFRGVVVSYLMRQWQGKRILLAVVLSSAVFGVSHLINLASGAPLGVTLLQVVNSFFMGGIFSAVFLRCGNLLPAMALHFLFDVVALSDVSAFQEGGIYNSSITLTTSDIIGVLITNIVYLAIILLLLRPSVREKIHEIWMKKWGRSM